MKLEKKMSRFLASIMVTIIGGSCVGFTLSRSLNSNLSSEHEVVSASVAVTKSVRSKSESLPQKNLLASHPLSDLFSHLEDFQKLTEVVQITDLATLFAEEVKSGNEVSASFLLAGLSVEESLLVIESCLQQGIESAMEIDIYRRLTDVFFFNYIDSSEFSRNKFISEVVESGLIDDVGASSLHESIERSAASRLFVKDEAKLAENSQFYIKYYLAKHPNQISQWLEQNQSSTEQRHVILSHLAEVNLEAVVSLLAEGRVEPQLTAQLRDTIVSQKLEDNPQQLFEKSLTYDFLRLTGNEVSELFTSWTKKDSIAASSALTGLPEGEQRDYAIIGMVTETLSEELEISTEWINSISDPELKAYAKSLMTN